MGIWPSKKGKRPTQKLYGQPTWNTANESGNPAPRQDLDTNRNLTAITPVACRDKESTSAVRHLSWLAERRQDRVSRQKQWCVTYPHRTEQRWARISNGSDCIRTEANFCRIRTGLDCSFFEKWRIRTGLDWENFCDFNANIINISRILVVIRFYRFAKW